MMEKDEPTPTAEDRAATFAAEMRGYRLATQEMLSLMMPWQLRASRLATSAGEQITASPDLRVALSRAARDMTELYRCISSLHNGDIQGAHARAMSVKDQWNKDDAGL